MIPYYIYSMFFHVMVCNWVFFIFLKRMRRGILREMEKARADKKAESVAEQKKSWNEWKEAKKAENRRKREV